MRKQTHRGSGAVTKGQQGPSWDWQAGNPTPEPVFENRTPWNEVNHFKITSGMGLTFASECSFA